MISTSLLQVSNITDTPPALTPPRAPLESRISGLLLYIVTNCITSHHFATPKGTIHRSSNPVIHILPPNHTHSTPLVHIHTIPYPIAPGSPHPPALQVYNTITSTQTNGQPLLHLQKRNRALLPPRPRPRLTRQSPAQRRPARPAPREIKGAVQVTGEDTRGG